MALSRRVFLGVTGAALAGGGALALQSTRLRPLPPGGLVVLTPAEYSIFAAVADRACPAPGPGVPSATDLDVAGQLDRLFARAEPGAVAGVKLALALLESGLAGALLFERVRPFTALAPEDQDRALRALQRSSLAPRRAIYKALTSAAAATYYGDPRAWPQTGYPGPPSPSGLRAAYAENLVDLAGLRAKS